MSSGNVRGGVDDVFTYSSEKLIAPLKSIPNIATLHTAYDKSIGAQI